MAGADGDDSLYPIAVLIDELRNEDVQVTFMFVTIGAIICFFYDKVHCDALHLSTFNS